MASEVVHIQMCNRTQATINHLMEDPTVHSPWIVVAAFYKALHLVEAVFDNDALITATWDHRTRNETLKRTNKYRHLYRHYSPLFRASLIARYLENDGTHFTSFDMHIGSDKVHSIFLKHHLHQVEECAVQFLQHPGQLQRVSVACP